MTYKRCGWLAGMCFLGVLLSGGMTENGRIDLFSAAGGRICSRKGKRTACGL